MKNLTISVGIGVLNCSVLEIEVILSFLMQLLKLISVVISILVVGKGLIIHDLLAHICVTVVLAHRDAHRRYFALIDNRMC
jgi:hypothetical protein